MDNYNIPSQHGKQLPIQTNIRDRLATLDVVWANKFEKESITPEDARAMEVEFYRGAPPQWLNFYWAEKEGSPFIKREMYEKIREEIYKKKKKNWSTTHIDLHHQPGSGASTLAMQILWDLRKEFRCARVVDSTTDPKDVARQVVLLYNAGSGRRTQNTVLLLLDNKCTSEDLTFLTSLKESVTDEMKKSNFIAYVPVVIILNCVRQLEKTKLCASLSEAERREFQKKRVEIMKQHEEKHTQFHAFNIMSRNYDPAYVVEVCNILNPVKKNKRPRKAQLLAYLALVNSYAPGSYLSHNLCQQFLGENSSKISLETQMQPFMDLLVIFSTLEGENRSEDRRVRMAHPMIADECLRLLTSGGVRRSDITRNLLTDLCGDSMPLHLMKRLFTKRELKEKFSRLIKDIESEEEASMCISVLQKASKRFSQDPFLPQALARFYYIKKADYEKAKHWAKIAIERDDKNSFIRDTLGQVYKNHFLKVVKKTQHPLKAQRILRLGKQAVNAFEAETKAAKDEQGPEMKEHGVTKISTFFNNRGLFGYMQVANIIYCRLENCKREWAKVLTKEISPQTFFNFCRSEKCGHFTTFLTSLRDEVESNFEFFEKYLIYSKPSSGDEPNYFWPEIDKCYSNYVTQSQEKKEKTVLQMLKERKVSTFAGLLNALSERRSFSIPDLEQITEHLRELFLGSQNDAGTFADAGQNYILANIILSQRNATSEVLKPLRELQSILKKLWEEQKDKRSPEFYLLVLLLFWPDGEQFEEDQLDLSECVEYMRQSFERTYKNYLRSRYLVPLFYLKHGDGLQGHAYASYIYDVEAIAEILNLQRVEGEVKNYKVFARKGNKEIEVSPQHSSSVSRPGQVTFYLGFNIRGPVAFSIRYVQ